MSLRLAAVVEDRGVDVAVEVPTGGRLALLGPNGAGKSTVLALLAGTLVPDEGEAVLDGTTLFSLGPGRPPVWVPPHRRRLALLAQTPLLFPRLTVRDNVAFGPRAQGWARAAARAEADRRLGEVGAADLADRRPRTLSGGQAQRVALARALAADPPLLLLDEPLSGIDAASRPALRALLAEVLARRPAVLVTHEADDAALAEHVVVLDAGRVVAEGPPSAALLGSLRHL